jgi:hypothetical protein
LETFHTSENNIIIVEVEAPKVIRGNGLGFTLGKTLPSIGVS